MADQSLRFPPFTPPDHFMCCICFDLVHVDDAWEGECYGKYGKWDTCVPCGDREAALIAKEATTDD